MARDRRQLRSQELRTDNHQGDALPLGMNWTKEDLLKPQVLVESARGMPVAETTWQPFNNSNNV
jgi:dihydroxy-acid dehydratase